jgi:outer membrane receptor protein involved in Fe transport
MKIGLVSAVATATLVLSASAFAQAPTSAPKPAATAAPPAAGSASNSVTTADYSEQRLDGSQVVTFGGDPLEGDSNSAYGFTIRRPPGVLRAQLIRPRVNFVSELLKSVENL